MIKVSRIKPTDYNATAEQIDNVAAEFDAKAWFDTHLGYPCIVVEFTFPDETTDFGALVLMGNFLQGIKHLKRNFFNRQLHF